MDLSRDDDVRRAYARDASGLELIPDAVARPTTIADVVGVVRAAISDGVPVTPAGAQTSTTAASIVDRGVLLSMRGMSRVLDIDPTQRMARVEPGVIVGVLNDELAPLGLRFAPDPTSEHEATIGGAIACNASGARSLRYGATRAHVRAVRVVNGNGDVLDFRRSNLEKNTVGFHIAQDQVDWIVGSEGTLGAVVEAELALVPLPEREVGLAIPFRSERAALAFVVAAREQGDGATGPRPQCLEYFDEAALVIARGEANSSRWMEGASALVYLEQAIDAGDSFDDVLGNWLTLAESLGASANDIDVYGDASAIRAARRFRHAVPSFMNERGSARRAFGGRKVSTDWAVPYRRLAEALDTARRAADAQRVAPPVCYGHAGNGHPHENFIAEDADELARINIAVGDTITAVLALGGTVAAEHGLGKLKRQWLAVQLSPTQLELMRSLKRLLDPHCTFAPGNVFSTE
ncbi:MAG TPA: FAD-binding oxidoreductase [Gemmatimonadaceae bacterium]|nr:FAD-binding oxidoreductase [Gemmatimonadaceae bacterium]